MVPTYGSMNKNGLPVSNIIIFDLHVQYEVYYRDIPSNNIN